MMWISVEDRLPDVDSFVLIYEPHCRDQAERGIDTAWYFKNSSKDFGKDSWITYWMPLPDPPGK